MNAIDRFGSYVGWPTSRKIVMLGSIGIAVTPLAGLVNAVAYSVAADSTLKLGLLNGYIVAWLVAQCANTAAAWLDVRAGREGRASAYAFVVVQSAFMVGLLHLFGLMSSPLVAIFPALVVLWTLCLDERLGLCGMATMTAMIVVVGVLEAQGLLPHAPIMRERSLDALGGAVWFGTVLFHILFLISLLVMASEIGGIAVAVEFATGVNYLVWVLPVAILAWALVWYGTFSMIENGISTLGLVTIAFVVAALQIGPHWAELGHGLVPTVSHHEPAHYGFIAVSILGASISPYLFIFYSSGAIEEKWDVTYLASNRVIAAIGMGFGGGLSVAVLVVSALVLAPAGIKVESYHQLPLLLSTPWVRLGVLLFAGSLFITCLGATTEIALALAYQIAQGFGWNWGEDLPPSGDARFSLTYTATLLIATLVVFIGGDPVKLTNISMALTAASLPVAILPFLVLMNDKKYLGEHTNGLLGNVAILLVSLLASVLAIVSIPLEIIGGS